MNIGGTEIFLILMVALLLFGAKNLPKIARGLGKSVEEFRRAAREVSREVMTADQDDTPPQPRQIAGGEQVAQAGEAAGDPGEPPAPSDEMPSGPDGGQAAGEVAQAEQKGPSGDEGSG